MTTKFNVKFSETTYQVLAELAKWMDGTMADATREAVSVFWWLAKEYRQGNKLLIQRGEETVELALPSLTQMKAESEAASRSAQQVETGSG